MPISIFLQALFFLWRIGFVDTYSFINLVGRQAFNGGAQYVAIVLGSAAGNYSSISPRVLLEPILGLGTTYQYVQTSKTVVGCRSQIAKFEVLMVSSSSLIMTADPATNASLGGKIAAKIAFMNYILDTRGSFQFLEFAVKQNPELISFSSLKSEFKINCNHIIINIFQEYTSRCYI